MNPEKPRAQDPDPGSADPSPPRRAQPSPAAMSKQGDARRDSGQLKKNQERLGVGQDHKTETMRRRRRGTFP